MCIAKNITDNLVKLFDQIKIEIENLKQREMESDAIIQDLLHEIEFTNFNAYDGWYLSQRLKTVRQQRRYCKNELKKMKSLEIYIKRHNNVKVDLCNIVKSIETDTLKENQKKYLPRVLNDLKLAKIQNSKPDTLSSNNLNKYKKLKKVNHTKIKFHPEVDRIDQLLQEANN